MQYEPRVIVGPATEVVTTEEALLQLRIEDDDPGVDLLNVFIPAARRWLERRTDRTIHQTEYEYALDRWPACQYILLPRATPLISITSLKYVDSDEASTTVDPAIYLGDTRSWPGRLVLRFGQSWPSAVLSPASPIRVSYAAGIAASPAVDADADDRYAVLLLLGGMWANRENEVVSDAALTKIALDYGVEAFIAGRMGRYVF